MDEIMGRASESRTTPAALQAQIRQETGVALHITYVRKLMHERGLSPKTATRIHINHASSRQVNSWRHRTKKRISRLKMAKFVTARGCAVVTLYILA